MVEPASVLLKYGFLIVLFLFLAWVSRNSLRDLRGRRAAQIAPDAVGTPVDATGLHSLTAGGDGWEPQLVVDRGPGQTPGMAFDIGDGAVLGRGDSAEIRLEDPFSSSRHARLVRQGSIIVIEDLGSTNGTYLGKARLTQASVVPPGTAIRIGKTVLELRK